MRPATSVHALRRALGCKHGKATQAPGREATQTRTVRKTMHNGVLCAASLPDCAQPVTLHAHAYPHYPSLWYQHGFARW